MLNIKDIAWLAGLLEGEGWFTLSDKLPTIGVSSTDLDTVEKIRALLRPSSGIFKVVRCNRKDKYTFKIQGKNAVAWMLTLYSLLSRRRRNRIKELVFYWQNKVDNRKFNKRNRYRGE